MRNTLWSAQRCKTVRNAASRLVSLFADVLRLPLERVHPDLRPGDVKRWDSLGHVALVVEIEEEFSIQFEVDEIMEFTSFRAILSVIERRLGSTSSDEIPAAERIPR